MNKCNFIFVSIHFFVIQFALTQPILTPKWTNFVEDLTILPQYQKRGEVRYAFQDKDDIILVSSCFQGWTVQKLNPQNGNLIWTNSQNQNFPDSTNKLYELLYANQLGNGTFEVIGKNANANFPGWAFVGLLLRIVYDNKTGKEIFRSTKTFNSKDFVEAYGGTSNPIISYNKEYRIFDAVPFSSSDLQIRSFDKDMTYVKTLNNFKMSIYDNIFGLSHISTTINYDLNSIYSFTYLFNTVKDTSSYRNIFRKFDMNGKMKIVKDVSKDVFYDLEYFSYKKVNDGFLVSGYVDTALTLIHKQKAPKWQTAVFKFDTLGNKIWSTFLPDTLNSLYQTITTCEDSIRKGYWAFTGKSFNTSKIYPELFFIKYDGSYKKVGKIVVKNDITKYESIGIWALSKGGLILSLKKQSCAAPTSDQSQCYRVAFLDKSQLDLILDTNNSEIEEITNPITLFPNPFNNEFIIKNNSFENIKVELFDILGRNIMNFNLDANNQQSINTESLAMGFYFIRTNNGRNQWTKKIIKN